MENILYVKSGAQEPLMDFGIPKIAENIVELGYKPTREADTPSVNHPVELDCRK